jgi:ribosomal protein S18 acetylase RimI-like enzyme
MTDYFTRHLIRDGADRGWLDYRLAPGETAEIVNIEVAGEHRRQGVGRLLLGRMIAALPPDIFAVYAFTRSSNAIACQWYRAMEFELTLVPRFYRAQNEDAFCCVKVLR